MNKNIMLEALKKQGIVEKLRKYTSLRAKLVDTIHPYVTFLEVSTTFHCLALFTAVTCMVALYAQIKQLTLFSLHPLCMVIGSFVFLAEGIVAYHNRSVVDVLSPIMAKTRQPKVRTLHQNVQTIGASFLGLGFLFIVAHKAEEKKTVLPHTVHSILGSVVIGLIIVQVVSGSQKMSESNKKIRRWHGDLGLLVWDMLCVTVLAGFAEFFRLTFTHVLVEMVIMGLWLAVHVQMKRKVVDRAGNIIPPTQDSYGDEGETAAADGHGGEGDALIEEDSRSV